MTIEYIKFAFKVIDCEEELNLIQTIRSTVSATEYVCFCCVVLQSSNPLVNLAVSSQASVQH